MMHAGLPFLEATIALMRRYRGVYADLSQINYSYPRAQFHEYLRALIQADLGSRLMFGSDQTRGPHVISAGHRRNHVSVISHRAAKDRHPVWQRGALLQNHQTADTPLTTLPSSR